MSKPRSRLHVGSGGLLYVVVSSLILSAAIYTQANLLFWSFGLMVGGLVISILIAGLMLRNVEVQRLLPSHGVAGEAMVIRYRLANHKAWTPMFGLVVHETWGKGSRGWRRTGPLAETPKRLKGRPMGWVLHLGANQTVLADAPCWPMRRGMLHFDRIVLSSSFPFGVLRRVVEFEQPGSVLVYPHLYRMNRRMLHRLSENDPIGTRRLQRAGGAEEFFGLRQYRAGDSLRMIDWKRSAKTGILITREMTQPSPPKIMLALDLSDLPAASQAADSKKPDNTLDESIEKSISLAASLVCDAHFNSYQIGLAVLGVPCAMFPVYHSLPHRTKILEALSCMDTSVRMAGLQAIPAEPTVVIRPGAAGPASGRRLVMGTEQMDQYTLEIDGGASEILSRRPVPRSRREELHSSEENHAEAASGSGGET